jgi:hypothetical protein
MTRQGVKMDLVSTEGGTMASIPARLLHDTGEGHKALLKVDFLAAEDPQFKSLCCHCNNFVGVSGADQEIPTQPSDGPFATLTK